MRIRKPINKKTRFVLGFISILSCIGFYSVVSWRQHVKNPLDTTVPNFSQLIEGISEACTVNISSDYDHPDRKFLWGYKQEINFGTNKSEYKLVESWLYADFKATYGRFIKGVSLSIFLSIIVGMLAGSFPKLDAFIRPVTAFQSFVPPTAALAIFFILVGTGENLYMAIILFGVFPSLTQSIFYAVTKDIEDYEIDKFYTLGASHFEVMYELVFLKIFPRILGSIRLAIGPVMVYLIATEWLVADVGFGYTLKIQSRKLNMAPVYFYLILLGTSGYLLDWSILTIRRKFCSWFGE